LSAAVQAVKVSTAKRATGYVWYKGEGAVLRGTEAGRDASWNRMIGKQPAREENSSGRCRIMREMAGVHNMPGGRCRKACQPIFNRTLLSKGGGRRDSGNLPKVVGEGGTRKIGKGKETGLVKCNHGAEGDLPRGRPPRGLAGRNKRAQSA